VSIKHPTKPLSFTILAVALVLAAALAVALLPKGQSRAAAGQFLNFPGPGAGYAEVPDAPGLTPATLTIEAWVNLRSYGHTGTAPFCPTIAGKNFEQSYWFGICNGRLRLIVRDAETVDGSSTIPLDTWTHVAGTYDGSVMRLYINAVEDGSKDIGAGPVGTSTDPLQIGHDPAWDASPDGLLDEVRLWDNARSDMQIAFTMNLTIAVPTPGLIAAWNFDGDATDPVGGHNGTLEGDVEIVSSVPTPSPTASPSPEPSPTEMPTPTPTETPTPTPTASPTATASPTPSPTPVPHGDVNCSGVVDAVDALQILRHVASLPVNLPDGCPDIGS